MMLLHIAVQFRFLVFTQVDRDCVLLPCICCHRTAALYPKRCDAETSRIGGNLPNLNAKLFCDALLAVLPILPRECLHLLL